MKRWPEQILRLGAALLPDAQGEGQKENEMKKMKDGDIVVIDGERYIISGHSVLGFKLTHLDGNGEPIKDESIWKPRNEFCEKLIDWTDRLDDFAGRYAIPISVIGVFLGIIDLVFFRVSMISDFILILMGGPFLEIQFFEWISEELIRLSVKLSERKKRRKKKLEE